MGCVTFKRYTTHFLYPCQKIPNTMAIRMEKDPGAGNNRRRDGAGNGGQQLAGLLKFLPILLLFFVKRPKAALLLIAVVAGLYFLSDGTFWGLLPLSDDASLSDEYGIGGVLDDEVYDKALVYEPLVAGNAQNARPRSVSLRAFTPNPISQGRQGSCVGWSSAYAARTVQWARFSGQNPNDVVFSPSFLYNQIALEGCQGAYIFDAMEKLEEVGALPLSAFPYDEGSCSAGPSKLHLDAAEAYRIPGFTRLSMDDDRYKVNTEAVKQNLAQGAPVVIGMLVGGTFMGKMRGKAVWQPTQGDYAKNGFSGHAMCVIGYDDDKAGGAFEIMNSWGSDWGENGYCWVKYQDFEYFVREAYGIHPMPAADAELPEFFEVDFGLVDVNRRRYLEVLPVAGQRNVFRTTYPVAAGDRFKVEITNNKPCFVYIFNEEVDGTSQVLFPYNDKHSPYCGITGTRIFPKDYSMVPDTVGNRDRIAIVIAQEALDFRRMEDALNARPEKTFTERVNAVFADQLPNLLFSVDKTVHFKTDYSSELPTVLVFEVEK